ncbi:hypothetical protein [Bosea sp. AAP35]|uniref:hypothetical protein n=1 Tax=Bosea sp. AAP35 TaxID=1523417 RepID=UPI0006B9DE10|nr:hypothetical protein [Bosea sp. AAP35]
MPVKPLLASFLGVPLVALPLLAGVAGASDACLQLPDTPAVRLSGLDEAGDPVLLDGRRLRLVGLAPRQDEAEAARFAAGIGPWRERDLLLVLVGEADRWGRLPARLFEPAAAGQMPRDVASILLGAGAASALPEVRQTLCGEVRLPAVRTRRNPVPATVASAGASAGGLAIDGHDLAALKEQEGRLVLLEGRIASVGERAQRTYLNFSRRRGEAASIVVTKRLWREMQDAGWTAKSVSGKRSRARGVLSGRDGLLLDVTTLLALELID